MYANIAFSLKLQPLTYKIPDYAPPDLIGRIVQAPLSNRLYYGLVLDTFKTPSLEMNRKGLKNIRDIQNIYHHFASESTIKFLKWLSKYYLMPIGIAIKSLFFDEAVSLITKNVLLEKNVTDIKRKNNGLKIEKEIRNIELHTIREGIKNRFYKSFLYHAPSILYEHSFLLEILKHSSPDINGAIILVPEIWQIEKLSHMMRDLFGERLCILHSKLSKNKRREAIKKIITGSSDLIIGTRSAVFAPLKNISFISVMNEHSPSYKAEEGLRYNGRDIAVMRGYMERSVVLLSSICPSVETIYNCKLKKYTLLGKNEKHLHEINRPKIKIIDTKFVKQKGLSLSPDVLKKAQEILLKDERFLFLVNRKGYSLLICEDCDYIFRCNKCHSALIFHKRDNVMRCHHCNYDGYIPISCSECKGFNIKPLGTGDERIKEELESFFSAYPSISEKITSTELRDMDKIIPDFKPFVIGTRHYTKKYRDELFSAAYLLNIDSFLTYGFKAYERAFQEVMQISQMVKKEGVIFLQTWNPKNKIFRFIKNYDFNGFYEHELALRREFNYPPFFKIIIINIFAKKDVPKVLNDIHEITRGVQLYDIEILGPVEVPSNNKSYTKCIQILMKSRDSKKLHYGAEVIIDRLKGIKNIKVNIDVDPLKI